MKVSFVLTVGALLFAVFVGTGCASRQLAQPTSPTTPAVPVQLAKERPSEPVITEAPPLPYVEVVGRPPNPDQVWLPGHWVWRSRWVWVSGRWTVIPRPEAAWVPGRWVHREQGWVWIPGYWH